MRLRRLTPPGHGYEMFSRRGFRARVYRKNTSSGVERVCDVSRFARWHFKIVFWRAG